MIALFDLNIVIDYLNGIPQAAVELAQYKQAYISPIRPPLFFRWALKVVPLESDPN